MIRIELMSVRLGMLRKMSLYPAASDADPLPEGQRGKKPGTKKGRADRASCRHPGGRQAPRAGCLDHNRRAGKGGYRICSGRKKRGKVGAYTASFRGAAKRRTRNPNTQPMMCPLLD